MTSFTFTTGNPSNLVANQNASMADIQGPFTDLRTFLNGGTMDETNVPNLAAAFTTYKPLIATRSVQTSAGAGGTYATSVGSAFTNGALVNAGVYDVAIEIDPTWFAANSRVTKLNLRFAVVPNAVAPAITFTAGLYPIATYGGASGAVPTVATIGTVVSGSTAAVATPGASTRVTATSGDFNCPAAGQYAIGVVTSGAPAAGSQNAIMASLQMRQV